MANILSSIGSAVGKLANEVTVQVDSAVTPMLTINGLGSSFGSSSDGTGNVLLRFLKPRVRVLAPDGSVLYELAPYGDPGSGAPVALVAGVGIAAAVGVAAYVLSKRR